MVLGALVKQLLFPRFLRLSFQGLLLLILSCTMGWANPMDTYGFRSDQIGMGGGVTASTSSYDASYYNPAGLARLQGLEAGLGVLLVRPFLHTQQRQNVTSALIEAGLGAPLPLKGPLENMFFLGASFVIPGDRFYAVRARPWDDVQYPLYGERNCRFVANLALAIRISDMFAIGGGVSLLPQVGGNVAVDFKGRDASTYVDVTIQPSPNLGFWFEPGHGLSFGLAWRGANRTDISLPVDINISDNIAPISLLIEAVDYSTPHEIAIGASWNHRNLLIAADATIMLFHQFRQSAPTVVLYDDSSAGKRHVSGEEGIFSNTIAIKAGAQWTLHPLWTLRVGGHFIQSPIGAQHYEANLLDGHRYGFSFGLGFDLHRWSLPLELDAHLAFSHLVSNHDEKLLFIPLNPGYPTIKSGGTLLSVGLGLRFDLR